MPEYIASGKDRHAETSIKVSAETPMAAFLEAKRRIPVVSGLERIEPDRSLVAITDLPFDSLTDELPPSPDEQRLEDARNYAKKRFRLRNVLILLIVAVILLEIVGYAADKLFPNFKAPPAPNSRQK